MNRAICIQLYYSSGSWDSSQRNKKKQWKKEEKSKMNLKPDSGCQTFFKTFSSIIRFYRRLLTIALSLYFDSHCSSVDSVQSLWKYFCFSFLEINKCTPSYDEQLLNEVHHFPFCFSFQKLLPFCLRFQIRFNEWYSSSATHWVLFIE